MGGEVEEAILVVGVVVVGWRWWGSVVGWLDDR